MDTARLIPLCLVLGLMACGGDKGATADNETEAVPASPAQADDDLQDISKFKLTMDRMDKYFQAQRNMGERLKGMTPEQREALDMSSDANTSLDEMVRKAESNPVMSDAIRKAGISPREFVMITMAYFQSAMAASVIKMRPDANADSLAREMKANPDNIKFVRDNEAELTAKYKTIEAEMKALEGTED